MSNIDWQILKTNLERGWSFDFKKYELAERANELGLDILAVSDVRMRGQVVDEVGNYRVYLSGLTRGRLNWGVGFLINKSLESSILCHRFVNERMREIDRHNLSICERLLAMRGCKSE